MSELNESAEFLVPTVREVQQMFAELLSHDEDITWDLLSANQGDILKNKVNEFKAQIDDPNSMRLVNGDLFDSIWYYRKYTNGQSLTSLFFVMIVENVTDPKLAEQSRSWYLYPVFRCRRCVENNTGQNNSSLECCMVYVNQYDSIEGWDNFVQNSRLRPGLMVTPNRGVYKLIDGEVELNAYCIPGRLRTKMLSRDRCISAEDVQEALIRPTESITNLKYDGFFGLYRVQLGGKLYDSVLYQLLVSGHRKSVIEAENLSDSLTLFTHGINNSRLSSLMIKDQNSSVVLGNYLKRVFDTIFWKTNRIEGKVDLIRSANEVPTKNDLYLFFHRKLRKQYNRCFSVEKNTIKVEDLGSALRNNIENQENIEILITVMTKHLKPEMIQLILQLTQSFMESTREELWQLLKYHISTDIVLYQVIRIVLEDFSNLDPNEVKEQSSYILGHIKARFVSYNPNSPPELLKKCRKCVGYYHISKIDLSAQ